MKSIVEESNYLFKRISQIIINNQYKKIVIQMPKQKIHISFDLYNQLTKSHINCRFFILFDSLKKSCCVDMLGAEHVGYDCLIHLGEACFSSPHKSNHYFIFDQASIISLQIIERELKKQNFIQNLKEKNIGYLLVSQKLYHYIKQMLSQMHLQYGLEVLRLAFDAKQTDKYLAFGYYYCQQIGNKNILVIDESIYNEEQQSNDMTLIEKVAFSLKSLEEIVGQDLFDWKIQQNCTIKKYSIDNNKKLMQRYSMISKLQSYEFFGIIVSNTSTSFFEKALARCNQILIKNNKKSFTFMMNNLNEVKLGNFPEIQVYVIISCFNNSLFLQKDFNKLVVTLTDLQIAFQSRLFNNYNFDLKIFDSKTQIKVEENQKKQTDTFANQNLQQIIPTSKNQIMLANKIQTLAYYKQKQFKGLQFDEKKEVKKMTKGKIGLAQKYTSIQQ